MAALVAVTVVLAISGPTRWLMLLLIAPVTEELVFRGGLHEALLRQVRPRHVAGTLGANALTALAFAAAHAANHATLLAGLTLLPALLIGHVYQQTRRLAPCIVLHALLNASWLLRAGVNA